MPPVRNRLMSVPVSARASSAARPPQPGIDSACCGFSSSGASSRSITSDRPGDLGVDPVDAGQHGGQQRGVLGGEELRAFEGGFQLADLAAGAGPGGLGQHLGAAFPGDEVVHDVPAGDPVQVGDHGGQFDRR